MMLWVIGAGLIFFWVILTIFSPRGWAPLLLLSGISVLIIQIAAYRKTKYALEKTISDAKAQRRKASP